MTVAPGIYRMRLCARGRTESAVRERSFKDDDDERPPLEHYLVELWPAAPSAAAVVRQDRQYAIDTITPPEPERSLEREAGLAAAWAVLRDLQQAPGARTLSGALTDFAVELQCAGTPARLYNRVGHAFGWPPCMGGSGSARLQVGAEDDHDATPPEVEAFSDSFGFIRTTIVEVDKPRRLVKTWNWVLPDADGISRQRNERRLLQLDATATLEFIKANGPREEPQTVVRLHLVGVPLEWVDDLRALWGWDIARFATAP